MPRPSLVTLVTDFGHQGPYVAAMKGVILSIAPETRLVDISHEITPQNIMEGAFILASVREYFPPGSIHLAVIDPGVGTDRRLVAARVAGQWFVLPDNGLISGVLRSSEPDEIRVLTNDALRRPKVSKTFHGRDILAPAAAHLSRGGDPAELGPTADSLVRLDMLEPAADRLGWLGEVIFRDSFGNLVTNVSRERLVGSRWRVEVKGIVIDGIVQTYADRPSGTLVALEGSSGWIELAVVNGDAARRLEAGPGTTVRFIREAQS